MNITSDQLSWSVAFRRAFDSLQGEVNGPIDWPTAYQIRYELQNPSEAARAYRDRHVLCRHTGDQHK